MIDYKSLTDDELVEGASRIMAPHQHSYTVVVEWQTGYWQDREWIRNETGHTRLATKAMCECGDVKHLSIAG